MHDVVIITGYSGAGKSTAMDYFEDNGYEVIDNLRMCLVEDLLLNKKPTDRPLALGLDTRTKGFDPNILSELATKHNAHILFLSCDTEHLLQRFQEKRRRHPMDKGGSLIQAIQAERDYLNALKEAAHNVVETDMLNVHDLRRVIEGHYGSKSSTKLVFNIMSFSYKKGLPKEADLVFDVRFLKNPHYQPHLEPLTGRDREVQDYIGQDPAFDPSIEKIIELVDLLLPRYEAEGKRYLTIAFGCTGGKHRSVFMAEVLGDHLPEARVQHRELT